SLSLYHSPGHRGTLAGNSKAKGWGWRTMRRNPGVYVRGRIRHADDATITLRGGHRGVVVGWLLALGEAEQDRLEAVVVEQGAAQDALVGRLDLFRQVEKHGVIAHAS